MLKSAACPKCDHHLDVKAVPKPSAKSGETAEQKRRGRRTNEASEPGRMEERDKNSCLGSPAPVKLSCEEETEPALKS